MSNLRFSFPSFPCFLAKSSWHGRRPFAKTPKLVIWAFSLNFLHEFTLFVIDIHQNMPISLILTPFDHFQIRLTFAVTPNLILEPCHMQNKKYKIKYVLNVWCRLLWFSSETNFQLQPTNFPFSVSELVFLQITKNIFQLLWELLSKLITNPTKIFCIFQIKIFFCQHLFWNGKYNTNCIHDYHKRNCWMTIITGYV